MELRDCYKILPEIIRLTKLKTLNLDGCFISKFSTELTALPNLEKVLTDSPSVDDDELFEILDGTISCINILPYLKEKARLCRIKAKR